MSAPEPMPSVRRRPIPGMTSQPVTAAPSPPPDPEPIAVPEDTASSPKTADPEQTHQHGAPHAPSGDKPADRPPSLPRTADAAPERRPAADYAATRLANFRIPVDLHDRYRRLVHEAEVRHPRVRRPSLTEVVVALLEEGPATPDEVAELIRRKRAAEHGLEV